MEWFKYMDWFELWQKEYYATLGIFLLDWGEDSAWGNCTGSGDDRNCVLYGRGDGSSDLPDLPFPPQSWLDQRYAGLPTFGIGSANPYGYTGNMVGDIFRGKPVLTGDTKADIYNAIWYLEGLRDYNQPGFAEAGGQAKLDRLYAFASEHYSDNESFLAGFISSPIFPVFAAIVGFGIFAELAFGGELLAEEIGTEFLAEEIGTEFLAEELGAEFLAEEFGGELLAEEFGGELLAEEFGGELFAEEFGTELLTEIPIEPSSIFPDVDYSKLATETAKQGYKYYQQREAEEAAREAAMRFAAQRAALLSSQRANLTSQRASLLPSQRANLITQQASLLPSDEKGFNLWWLLPLGLLALPLGEKRRLPRKGRK